MPEFDADPVEDDFYGFRDNEIQRVDSNQAELTLPAGGSVNEVEMTKHDLDSDKETVPLPDGSSLEPNPVEQDVIPVAVQEVEDPFVAPPEEIAPPFIFEDGGSTDVEEYMLCAEEDVLLYAQRLSFNNKLPPFWLERVEVMLTQADESGTHADELLAEYDMLVQELELEMGFQEDQFSALTVSMIVHADEMNVLSNELSVETNRHLGNLDIIFLEHERLAIQEDFQLVLEDCDRLDKVALGLRRCAAYLTECVQYYQQLQDGEEKGDEVEFLPQEQEAAEVVLLEFKPNEDEDEDWWPENPHSVQQVKEKQTLEEEEEVPESWEDRL